MKHFYALGAACSKFLNRFSKTFFFWAFLVTTAINFLLACTVPEYTSFYLSSLGGFFFGMMYARREPSN